MQQLSSSPPMIALRGAVLHFLDDPAASDVSANYEYFPDGILLVENGKVAKLGEAQALLPHLHSDCQLYDYRGRLILPGFIDAHIHYSQCDVIASYGAQLLDWLENHTFPAERRLADPQYAEAMAEFFFDELLKNGTTTAMVFATVHPQSVDAFFTSAQKRRLRVLAGKVLMDRNAPEFLRDTPQQGYDQSLALIERWHGRGRLSYALTPRFAPTSSPEQLALCGQLADAFPEVHIQSHVAENKSEVAWVRKLFPERRSYLDVYDHYGLLRPRSVYAHCIHLDEEDRRRMGESGAAMAFCPTSNLFLGSGLFDAQAARAAKVPMALGSDVGGGTSFSLLQTLNEAYKVLQMHGQSLSPLSAFYLVTLGGARALYLDQHIGNFAIGKEADLVVLDCQATPLLARRMDSARTLEDRLFALMILGDDRVVAATHILGEPAYRRPGVVSR